MKVKIIKDLFLTFAFFALNGSFYSLAYSQHLIRIPKIVISSKLSQALVKQYPREKMAESVYRGFSYHFRQRNLPGFGHWLKVQADEEAHHANIIKKHLFRLGVRHIEEPLNKFKWPSNHKVDLLTSSRLSTNIKKAFAVGLK